MEGNLTMTGISMFEIGIVFHTLWTHLQVSPWYIQDPHYLSVQVTVPLMDVALECLVSSSGRHHQKYVLLAPQPYRATSRCPSYCLSPLYSPFVLLSFVFSPIIFSSSLPSTVPRVHSLPFLAPHVRPYLHLVPRVCPLSHLAPNSLFYARTACCIFLG